MRSLVFLSLMLFSIPPAFGQTGIPLASTEYSNREKTLRAAPGQLVVISVFGVRGRFPAPILTQSTGTGLPTVVNGLQVAFAQASITQDLPIIAIQQTPCPSTGSCTPATAFTVQIPFELEVESPDPAKLRIVEDGSLVAEIGIAAVTDRIHVINRCDETGVFLSMAFEVPSGLCLPMVMNLRDQKLVTADRPAQGGDVLTTWAYGLGKTVDGVTAEPVTVQFFFRKKGIKSFEQGDRIAPLHAGSPGLYLYQIHVFVPPPPDDLAACSGSTGNMRVLISGPSSADYAEICVR